MHGVCHPLPHHLRISERGTRMSRLLERILRHSVPGNYVPGRTAHATLKRMFAVLCWSGLLIALSCWVNPGETAEPSITQEVATRQLATARQQFNAGQVNEAEKLAQICRKLPVRWKLFGDNPDKLLEEIKECRQQEAAW